LTPSAISLQDALDAVTEVLSWRLGNRTLDADARLDDLGLDSLDAAELFLRLEEKAGRPLDPASAGELERVEDLTKLKPAS
jgi:acyl carrier protein